MRNSAWRGRMTAGLLASAAAGLAGCGGTTAGDKDVDFTPPPRPSVAPPAPGAPAATPPGYVDMPTPPADARFTIYCQAYEGPDHQDNARKVRDLLRTATPYHKWYVVHGEQESTLYYGFYRTTDRRDPTDAAEGERAMADLTAIRTLHDSRGTRLFSASLPVPIDSPDPAANPAWDVTRSNGYWSLEVGTFKDSADRKLRAVEAVAEARKAGYPAFYYHGPHASSVCMGAWPKAAASEVTVEEQNTNPDQPILVTPNRLSKSFADKLDPNIQRGAPHVEPVDPSMIQMIAAFPAHAVNGYAMMKPGADGKPTDVPVERAFLFKITDVARTGPSVGSNGAIADNGTVQLAPPSRPGTGILRQLDQ